MTTTLDHNALLHWDRRPTDRYHAGWFIGSEGENGEHQQNTEGWPYSVYRKGALPGVSDIVLAHGIQSWGDALTLCSILNDRIAA
jgi:hypothetical protein